MRLLFIAPRFPYPPEKGDQLTVYRRLKVLAKYHDITLLSFIDHDFSEENLEHVRSFCKGGVYTVPFRRSIALFNLLKGSCTTFLPLQNLLYQSKIFQCTLNELLAKHTYDVAHFFLIRMAPYVSSVRKYKIPCVLDMVDSMTLNLRRRIPFEKGIARWGIQYEEKRVSTYEREVHSEFDELIVCAKKDLDYIPGENISIIPSAVMTEEFFPKLASRKKHTFIFSGNLSYAPNVHAVEWFMDKVYPLLKWKDIPFSFNIIGRNPAEAIKKSVYGKADVHLVGFVPSMVDALNEASFAIAPMQSGSGMQGKILEAMACGIPVLSTSLGRGSIEANPEQGLFVADTPEEFCNHIVDLLTNKERCGCAGVAAREFIVNNHEVQLSLPILEHIYEKVIATSKTNGTEGRSFTQDA